MAWPAAHEVSWDQLTRRAVTLARDAGALTVLPIFLFYRPAVHIYAGEFAAALALIAEADAIVEATGNTRWRGTSLLTVPWRGQEDQTLKMAEASIQAATARGRLEERTRAAGTDWALGIQARSRALISDSVDADTLYREAIERLSRTRIVVHRARAQLLYGEWLRHETAVWTRESTCVRRTTRSVASEQRRSPSAQVASCSPPVKPSA